MIKFNFKNFKNIKQLLSVKALIAIVVLALFLLLMYHCPFSYILGISCPGCGMTRSLISVLCLDFHSAFYFHPLWWLVIIFAAGALLEYIDVLILTPKLRTLICAIVATALFVVYFIRLFSGSDIVTFNWQDSLIYSIFN